MEFEWNIQSFRSELDNLPVSIVSDMAMCAISKLISVYNEANPTEDSKFCF